MGTFWGLIGTVGSVSNVISGLNFGNQDTSLIFPSLQEGLETPLEGMSTAFSSSLFGLAGSLILVLDLGQDKHLEDFTRIWKIGFHLL